MTTLVSIAIPAARIDHSELEAHRLRALPVVVISPHNQCDCHCVMCDIWKIREAEEVSVPQLGRYITAFRALGVRWVVFTGGEPQKNRNLPALAKVLRDEGIRVTLLTAGLLLETQAEEIAENVDDVIVSLDGPSLVATAESARNLGLNSISFLAADISSTAFNRPSNWSSERQAQVALDPIEVEELEAEMQRLINEHPEDFDSGFIAESPEKLHRIVQHFRASFGQTEPIAPCCNAPWVSAVIEAGGDVRPCFFHRSLGNTRDRSLEEILNSDAALQFRASLDITSDPICRRCVCSLYIPNQETIDTVPSTGTVQATHGGKV